MTEKDALPADSTDEPSNPALATAELSSTDFLESCDFEVTIGADGENLPTISAEKLHQIILEAHQLGLRVKLREIKGLLAMERTGLYKKFAAGDIAQYGKMYLRMERSETYECLRVAKALEKLPLCEEAYDLNDVSWSALREIVRVSEPQTEEAWVELARDAPLQNVLAEVRYALRNQRKLPRKKRFGLPNERFRFSCLLEPEKYAMVEKALEMAADEAQEALGGKRLAPHEALVFVAEWFLREYPVTASDEDEEEQEGASEDANDAAKGAVPRKGSKRRRRGSSPCRQFTSRSKGSPGGRPMVIIPIFQSPGWKV